MILPSLRDGGRLVEHETGEFRVAPLLARSPLVALYTLLIWPVVASGGYRGWPLAVVHGLALAGLVGWLGAMLALGRLAWRSSAIDLPFGLLVLLVVAQIVVGNGRVVDWALAPAPPLDAWPAAPPAPFLTVGTVAPANTFRSLLLMLVYAATYVLAVHALRERRQIERLIQVLLVVGAVLSFAGLLDYLAGDARLLSWRDTPMLTRRLHGTFPNPTHFGAWLGMMVCLGLGYAASRQREPSTARTPGFAVGCR